MKPSILCTFYIGYFLHISAAAKNENVHIKIHVPELIHQHNHQHTIYKDTPTARYEITVTNPNGGKDEHIVLHSHDYHPQNEYEHKENYAYNPEKKHKPKQKKAGKKKSKKQKKKKYGDDQDFKQVLENYDLKPEKSEGSDHEGGFKTSVRTEHYEVKKINPNARYPDEKYIIEGAYKVQETDPWGKPVTSIEKYDSPISKIAASILSKYDYTNFRPGESDSYNNDKDEDRNHENIEYNDGYDNNNDKKQNSQGYSGPSTHDKNQKSPDYSKYETYEIPNPKNNGKDYEKSAGYQVFVNEKNARYSAPYNYVPAQTNHQALHARQANTNQKPQGYTGPQGYGTFKPDDSKRVENLEKRPVEVEYIAPRDNDSVQRELEYEFEKEFGHLVRPSHGGGSDAHYDYDSEWEKHLIDYLYGENHAASTKFVQKVKPEHARRA